MEKITVHASGTYDILIDKGCLSGIGQALREHFRPCTIAILSDDKVFPLYGKAVTDSLQAAGFRTVAHVIPNGEQSKTLDNVTAFIDCMVQAQVTRTDMVLALGGGVVGDMAGFAAATYLRGIEFVQVPTSLLAQVDSSVGGKTGYDIPQGKNLVGAFWQPSVVLIDPDTLSTLPERYLNDGMAEVIKYGCIKSAGLFRLLKKGRDELDIENIIHRCVSIKRDVVQKDEKESGERKLLNFGHTIGHALEKIYEYKKLSHGEAVAIGMVMMTKASEKDGYSPKGTANKIAELCEMYNLPTHDDSEVRDIAFAAQSDKKSSGHNIDVVILKSIGDATVSTMDLRDFQQYIDVPEEV